ncbi:MAG: carboxypeptidase-like regulatory domain-containing protein [Bacteroidota bacterium]
MNSRQEAKFNMFDAVFTHCDENAVTVATVPAFATAVNSFEVILDDLREAAQQEISIITGHAANKAEQKQSLIEKTLDIAGAIAAFAASTNNTVLKEQVTLTYSGLNRLRDELLSPQCSNILDAALANAAALIPFGVTVVKTGALSDAIDAYSVSVPAPRNAVANRTSISQTIKLKLEQGDEMLKEQMDMLAVQFKTTHLGFYNAYKANREILDPASSATKLEGAITDDATSDPVVGASVQVVGQPYNAVADGFGEYSLTIPVPGTYNIQFSKSGYDTKTVNNVVITLGQSTDLDTTMQQSPV